MHIDPTLSNWLITSYFLGTAAFSIPFSKFSQQFGICRTSYVLLSLTGIFYFISYFITNIYLLIILRFLVGCSSAGLHSIRNSMSAIYAKDRNFSINATLVLKSVLLAVCPTAGSLFIQYCGIGSIFLVPGSCCILSILGMLCVEEWRVETHLKFDFLGSLVLSVVLVCVNLALTLAGNGLFTFAFLSLTASCALGALLCCLEKRHPNPILRADFLKPVRFTLVLNVVNYYLQNSLSFVFPQMLKALGYSTTQVGLLQSCAAAGGIAATALSAVLLQRLSLGVLLVVSYLLFVLTVIGGMLTRESPIFALIMTSFFALGLASTTYGQILVQAPPDLLPAISGLPTSTRMVGSALAYSLSSIGWTLGREIIVFVFVTALACVALGLSAHIFRINQSKQIQNFELSI
eukprot:EST47466.1 Major facilitator superfamily protein [Spironucleus salmonicida]